MKTSVNSGSLSQLEGYLNKFGEKVAISRSLLDARMKKDADWLSRQLKEARLLMDSMLASRKRRSSSMTGPDEAEEERQTKRAATAAAAPAYTESVQLPDMEDTSPDSPNTSVEIIRVVTKPVLQPTRTTRAKAAAATTAAPAEAPRVTRAQAQRVTRSTRSQNRQNPADDTIVETATSVTATTASTGTATKKRLARKVIEESDSEDDMQLIEPVSTLAPATGIHSPPQSAGRSLRGRSSRANSRQRATEPPSTAIKAAKPLTSTTTTSAAASTVPAMSAPASPARGTIDDVALPLPTVLKASDEDAGDSEDGSTPTAAAGVSAAVNRSLAAAGISASTQRLHFGRPAQPEENVPVAPTAAVAKKKGSRGSLTTTTTTTTTTAAGKSRKSSGAAGKTKKNSSQPSEDLSHALQGPSGALYESFEDDDEVTMPAHDVTVRADTNTSVSGSVVPISSSPREAFMSCDSLSSSSDSLTESDLGSILYKSPSHHSHLPAPPTEPLRAPSHLPPSPIKMASLLSPVHPAPASKAATASSTSSATATSTSTSSTASTASTATVAGTAGSTTTKKPLKPTKALDFIRKQANADNTDQTSSNIATAYTSAATASGKTTASSTSTAVIAAPKKTAAGASSGTGTGSGGLFSKVLSLWGPKSVTETNDMPALVPISPKHNHKGMFTSPSSTLQTVALTPVQPMQASSRNSCDISRSHEDFIRSMDDLCAFARLSEDMEKAGADILREDDDLMMPSGNADAFEALLDVKAAPPITGLTKCGTIVAGVAPNAGVRTATAAPVSLSTSSTTAATATATTAGKKDAFASPAPVSKKNGPLSNAAGTSNIHAQAQAMQGNSATASGMFTSPGGMKKSEKDHAFFTPPAKENRYAGIAEDALKYARELKVLLQQPTPATRRENTIDVCTSKDSDDEDDVFMTQPAPSWASRENLLREHKTQRYADPDVIFPPIDPRTCDLEAIFKDRPRHKSAKPFRVRTSSGNWDRDMLTQHEIDTVNRQMNLVIE